MRKILNHPNLVGENGNYEDSGKFIALNELFEQLGFREEESAIQNKVHIFHIEGYCFFSVNFNNRLALKTLPEITLSKVKVLQAHICNKGEWKVLSSSNI